MPLAGWLAGGIFLQENSNYIIFETVL